MALEGSLHDMSLIDLFEIFRMSNKSGILRIFCPDQHSSIYVSMGRLIDAAVHDASTRQLVARGDGAIVQLLKWEAGEFTFTHDPLTIRHPVTIFHDVDQLIRLNDEAINPTLLVARPPHMAMPISANLAFMHDLAPAYAADQQIDQPVPSLAKASAAYDASIPAQPFTAAQMRRLVLLPLADLAQGAAAKPAPSGSRAGQEYAAAQATQPVQAPRAVVSTAGRKLLAAVLRRVRAL